MFVPRRPCQQSLMCKASGQMFNKNNGRNYVAISVTQSKSFGFRAPKLSLHCQQIYYVDTAQERQRSKANYPSWW
jgi:hypothetical protein